MGTQSDFKVKKGLQIGDGHITIQASGAVPAAPDSNTVHAGESGSGTLRIRSDNGYIDVGSRDNAFAHIETDRAEFYFNKEITVDTGIVQSYDEDLILRRDRDDTTYNEITLGDDTFKITLDDSDRFYIDGDGDVGIGTTSPDSQLHIIGVDDGLPDLRVQRPSVVNQWIGLTAEDSGSPRITSSSNEGNKKGFRFECTHAGNGGTPAGSNNFAWLSGDIGSLSTWMTLTDAGKLGIGTTSPEDLLHISKGNLIFDQLGNQTSGDFSNHSKILWRDEADSTTRTMAGIGAVRTAWSNSPHALVFYTGNLSGSSSEDYDESTEKMRITDEGNVGINDTSPGAKLHVTMPATTANAALEVLRLEVENSADVDLSGSGPSIDFWVPEDSSTTFGGRLSLRRNSGDDGDSSTNMYFATKNEGGNVTDHMYLDEVGELAVISGGTGYLKMKTSGSTGYIKSDFNLDLYADDTDGNSADYQNIRFYTAGANERMRISNDGNVGIGTDDPSYGLDVQGASARIRLKDTSDTDDMHILFSGSDNNHYGLIGYDGSPAHYRIEVFQNRNIVLGDNAGSGKVGVTNDMENFTPTALFHVDGHLKATTKSFAIRHPDKPGMVLQHGSLEGPEHGVYVRGRLEEDNCIELPEYWLSLVDENSITVQLTPYGKHQELYVERIEDNKVYVGTLTKSSIDCFYFIQAERKDVGKIEVEY